MPTSDGRLVLADHALALLEYVPGRELEGESEQEQRWIASTLAGVHLAGIPNSGPSSATFMTDWLAPGLPGVGAHPWLVQVVEAVRAETDPLNVTWSVLHTDPPPEAFVHDDSTGVTELIDWAGAQRGPVMYDVASAVMYLGGTERAAAFLSTYPALGPLAAQETQQLDAFRRFREAIQGAYFARRLAANGLTSVPPGAASAALPNDSTRPTASVVVGRRPVVRDMRLTPEWPHGRSPEHRRPL